MKKKLLMMLMCGCLAFTGCGNDKPQEEQQPEGTPTPEAENNKGGGLINNNSSVNNREGGAYWDPQGTVVLGNYFGVEVDKIDYEVTEEDIQKEIDYFLYYQGELVEITDRTVVEADDFVNISFSLTVDGEEVDSDDGYDLEIGTNDLEFENDLIGLNVGDTKEFTKTIEDEYNYKDYVGQEGVYSVTINQIMEEVIPELTDELVADKTDFATVEEYKQNLYDELYASKEESAKSEQIVNGFKKIIEDCSFSDLNEEDVQSYVDEMVDYYESFASTYGMDIDTLLQIFTGTGYDEFVESMKEAGDYIVKQNLVLMQVAAQEKMELTDQEYADGIAAYTVDYGFASPEEFLASASEEDIREALLMDKAYNKIVDSMVIKE